MAAAIGCYLWHTRSGSHDEYSRDGFRHNRNRVRNNSAGGGLASYGRVLVQEQRTARSDLVLWRWDSGQLLAEPGL